MTDLKSIKFSVITCTMNSERFLEKTISSVQLQSHTNFEHIFIDGNSTDNTKSIIDNIKGNQTRFYIRDRKGIANAMNEGIRVATGDIVLHLHSDDYLAHSEVLSRVSGYFTSNLCQWIYGRALLDNNSGWTPEAPSFPVYSYRRLLQGNIIPHATTFVRRNFYQKIGFFNEDLKYAMDYDMWLRMGKVKSPIQYPEFFSVFRIHQDSTTFSNRMASFSEDHAVRRMHSNPFAISTLINEVRVLRRMCKLQTDITASGVKQK